MRHNADWSELKFDLNRHWHAVYSENQYGGEIETDEAYLQFENASSSLRLGRTRSGFGFGSWSDLWYSPVVSAPICRFMPLADGMGLMDAGSGAELTIWKGDVQAELGILDRELGEHETMPRHMDQLRGRLQVHKGDLIVGFNALTKRGSFSGESPRVLGLDYRWSAPRVLVRGEAMQGYGAGKASGFYTDLTYRPPHFPRTQVACRYEGYKVAGVENSSLYTFGVRQVVTTNLALTLNYTWGQVPDFLYSMRGWQVQAALGVRFE
jgi:hypothetical protein